MSELTTLFKNTADAIRSKTGDTATMQASQFPAKIQGISVGISQDEADARYLQLSGGTMTGDLILNGAPMADNQAATKAYVDSKAGGTKSLIDSVTVNYQPGYIVTVPQAVLLGDDFDIGIVQRTNAVISSFASGMGSGNMFLIGSKTIGAGLNFYTTKVPTTFPAALGREIRLHCFLNMVTFIGSQIESYEYTFGSSAITVTAADRNFMLSFNLNSVTGAQYPSLILNFYQ